MAGRILFSVEALLLVGSLLMAPPVGAQQISAARAPTPPSDDAFQARMVLVLSDADMVPSAYLDGKPGPVAGADALSVIAFDGHWAAPASVRTLPSAMR